MSHNPPDPLLLSLSSRSRVRSMKQPSPYPTHLFHAQILATLLIVSWFLTELVAMTVKGGTSQACAACKYQRRRCSKDCALAPYFPADQPKMFQNAHRLFGVSNIMKILRKLHQPHQDEAMRSIIYESNMRARFPVLGCWGIIYQLHLQVQQVAEELGQVRAQLALCKEQCAGMVGPHELELGHGLAHYASHEPTPAQGLGLGLAHYAGQEPYLVPDLFGCGDNSFDHNGKTEDMIGNGSSFYQIRHQEIDVSRHEYEEIATDINIGDEGLSPNEACDASMESTVKEVSTNITEGLKKMTKNMRQLELEP